MKQAENWKTEARAFTLIELMVVMAIIVTLIAVLIPVVSKVRQSGYQADTQNEISQIASACERYYTDFQAYPGPISNDAIRTQYGNSPQTIALNFAMNIPGAGSPVATPTANYITQSENLVLGLMGGLQIQNGVPVCNPYPIGYTPPGYSASGLVGGGAQFLNPANPGGAAAYLPAGFNLSTNYNNQNKVFLYQGAVPAYDCAIPVFVDRYPDSMPILYARARKGYHGVVSNSEVGPLVMNNPHFSPPPGPVSDPNGNPQAIYQYDVNEFWGYTDSLIGSTNPDQNGKPTTPHGLEEVETSYTYSTSPPLAPPPYNALSYLVNAGIQPPPTLDPNYYGAPQKADGFILISAGSDRRYGTADDLTNFGSVR